jgi:hypothetical protein
MLLILSIYHLIIKCWLQLTRTIKKINLSHFLHNNSCFLDSLLLGTKPTAQLPLLKPVYGDSILLISSLVPRHSKRPLSLYQDLQKVRHAPLIPASKTDYPDSWTLPPGLHSTSQRLHFLLPGR